MQRAVRTYVILTSLPFLLAMAGLVGLTIWDPLNLRGFGEAGLKLDERNYPLAIRPFVAPTQLAQRPEVIMAGTSTSLRLTGPMLAQLGSGGKTANISQAGQTSRDARALFLAAARNPGARRLLLEIGEYWRRPWLGQSAFGKRTIEVLEPKWWQLPEFNSDVLAALLAQARGGTFYLPQWSEEGRQIEPSEDDALDNYQIEAMEHARVGFSLPMQGIDAPKLSCERYALLLDTLDRVFATSRRNKIRVDIVFPPNAFAAYPFYWTQIGEPDGHLTLMKMHRCVVERAALEDPSRVAVHAINIDPLIVGDTSGMFDAFHYGHPRKLRRMVEDVANGNFLLKPDNFDQYERELRSGIERALNRPIDSGASHEPSSR
ncbi:hypothetical protein ACXYL9_13395 [Qipengyuania sp. CAU 1752]